MKDLLIEYRKTRLNVLNKIKDLENKDSFRMDDLLVYKRYFKRFRLYNRMVKIWTSTWDL